MEAMSFRLPVVASRTGGLPELIREGQTGFLFPTGNAAAMADRLTELARDGELRRAMGEAGYRDILANHLLENTVGRYVELILG